MNLSCLVLKQAGQVFCALTDCTLRTSKGLKFNFRGVKQKKFSRWQRLVAAAVYDNSFCRKLHVRIVAKRGIAIPLRFEGGHRYLL